MTGFASAEGAVEVNVGFASERGRQDALSAADDVVREFGSIDAVTARMSGSAASALESNPNIRYVERNGKMEALAQTLPWGIDRVDADVLHGEGETGSSADIAILDTGIDSDHPDLQGNIQGGKNFAADACGEAGGIFCSTNDNTCNYAWDDDNDHGTHCAGSADAIDNSEGVVGVSTEANLWAGKVLDGCGSGSYDDIAAGIEWAADQGFDVASMSLGGDASSVVKDACQYAYGKGVLLVAAAGNDGECTDCVGYPAAYDECVAVSATSSDDSLASFSSTGPEVELAAPGEDVYSTVPGGYETFSGTSMATPHVAGAGGQVMANGESNTEARSTLQSTAEDIGLGDNEQGYGLLDAEAAVLGGGDDGGDASLAVSTGDATDVTDSSATLNGSLDDLGGASSAEVYFEYGESGTSLDSTTGTQTLFSTGSFSAEVSGLNSGTDYDFRAVAEASDGDTATGSSVTFTTDSSGGSNAPVIDTFSVSNRSNGGWARFEVDWAVSDADGDLSSVDLTLSQSGSTVDSASNSVSGSSASGSDRLQDKKGSGSYDVTITVTDSNGNTASQTQTVSA
jgi:subtilisin